LAPYRLFPSATLIFIVNVFESVTTTVASLVATPALRTMHSDVTLNVPGWVSTDR
jgi:hypothetical protein